MMTSSNKHLHTIQGKQYGTILFVLLIVFGISACKQQSKAPEDLPFIPAETSKAQIIFNTKVHDYGIIEWKGNGKYQFVFHNKGTEPLVLSKVNSTCGCTVPEWPHDPIAPGDSSAITVKYNTKLIGSFSKSIVVHSNAENENGVLLKIKGKVEDTAAPAAAAQE